MKAFNTVNPRNFANPVSDGVRVAVPIATDDREAAEITAALVRDIGLEPVYAGPLSVAKQFDRLQQFTVLARGNFPAGNDARLLGRQGGGVPAGDQRLLI